MDNYAYVPVGKIKTLSETDLISWIRENVRNGDHVSIVCSNCGRTRWSPNSDVKNLDLLDKCGFCDKEYLLYDVVVGIPNKSDCFSQNIFVTVKNNQIPPLKETDKRVIDYIENKFPDKKVLNIGFRKEEVFVIE